jgi:hypothetical protein
LADFDAQSFVADYLEPVSLLVASRLFIWREYSMAIKFSDDCLSFFSSLTGTVDLRILNSQYLEHHWTGAPPRAKKIQYVSSTHRKNVIAAAHAENAYHAIVAVGKTPLQGYMDRRKKIDIVCENLECIIAQCMVMLRPIGHLHERRSLDTHTSIKELYLVFSSVSVDSLLSDLAKFKKNPRYIEMVTLVVEWSFQRGQNDTVIRICNEMLEWLTIRNRYIQNPLIAWEDSEFKREIFTRKKKPLFKDYNNTVEANNSDSRRSRSDQLIFLISQNNRLIDREHERLLK